MHEEEWVEKLTKEGFKNVSVSRHGPNMVFGVHTHQEPSVHLVLQGELTFTDQQGTKTVREGGRIEFAAGTTHTAVCGADGCTFVLGFRR